MLLASSLNRNRQVFGEKIALIDEDRRWTWREVVDRVTRLAAGLKHLGVGRGDRVAMLMANSSDSFLLFHAIPWLGAAIVPINTRWTTSEVTLALGDCEPRLLIMDHPYKVVASEAAAASDVGLLDAGGASGVEALIAEYAPIPAEAVENDTLLAIFYTGGTSGRSKGVMLSHQNVTSNGLAMLAEGLFANQERFLHCSPMFHIAGASSVFLVALSGASSVMLRRFAPGDALAMIQAHRCTQTLLVPTMIQMVLDHPAFEHTDLSSLARILYGASPIPEPALKRAMLALPSAALTQLYGMTELSPVCTVLHAEELSEEGWAKGRLRSAGRATIGVELKIVGPDDASLGPRQVGEIVVRGPNVMMGYWRRPEETAEALRGGWMHTGDGGYLDDEGFLYVSDRIKDMIITGGENVYSVEVESILAEHPAVQQCAVIGVPHDHWGEQVHGVVMVRDGHEIVHEDLEAWCRSKMAAFKVPRSFEIRREPLPISAAGKLLKRVLRESYQRP